MIGQISIFFRRLGWRHLIWILVLAGITYVSLPFFYAADYTWHLLHPNCMESEIENVQGEWIQVEEAYSGSFLFWYVPAENGRMIVLVGGRGGTLSDWQAEVNAFVNEGYGVAVLADPGCNLPISTLGFREKNQITAVVEYLTDDKQIEWIGAAGFSAGASALALAVPEMDQVRMVVLMGNFADLKSEMMYTPYKVGSIGWLGQQAVSFWYWLFTGNKTSDVSPITAYKAYEGVNVFLVHGQYEVQRTQAEKQLEILDENESVNAELWIVPGAYHGMYDRVEGDIYLRTLIDFFNGD